MTDHTHSRVLRALPFSREAEQSVIGALMLDPRAWAEVRTVLQPAMLFDALHADILRAAIPLLDAGRPVEPVVLYQALRDAGVECDLPYLEALAMAVPSARGAALYAEIVREKAAQRALLAAADEAATLAVDQRRPIAERIERIAGLFAGLQRAAVRQVPTPLADVVLRRMAHYEALEAGTVQPGWSTGLPALDVMLCGGMRAGGLYILAARPSVGKSSFAQHIGLTAARAGLPTLMLSQEMTADELADRAVASTGRVALGRLLSGRMDRDGWGRAVDALEALRDLPMHVDDQPALTLGDIRAKARLVRGLRVLVVDYLQLCSSTLSDASRNGQIEEISRGLKALAKDLGVAVIALSQLNRDVEKRQVKRPCLADLRDSGAIEQDADAVLMLWPTRELPSGHKLVGLAVEKNRQGRCGEVALDFDGATQTWHESTEHLHPASRARNEGFE